ncbi:MAG: zinc-binding dehydrogenase [Gemmatimonadaceae bacterium]
MRPRSTYAAAVMPAPHGAMRVDEVRAPTLEAGGALLHVTYSEVCGTDVHLHHGRLAGVPYPIIPGHVSVGTIAALPGPLNDVEGVPYREGDVVTFLDVHGSCGRCYQCLVTKQTTRCPLRKVYGISYGLRDGLAGGWAQAIWLKPGTRLVRLPRELSPETCIGGGCGLVTAVHAVERAEVRVGMTVAVLGVGPVGQSAIALAALSGAVRIFAIGDPASRRDFARRMGATDVIGLDMPPNERAEFVRRETAGHGVDAVIEAAGSPDAVPQALDLVRDGGRVVVAGQYTDTGDVRIHPHWQINRKHVDIRGCWGSDYSHVHRAVQIAAHFGARVPWAEMIGGRYSLAEAGAALAAVEQRQVTKAVIVPSASSGQNKEL